jgi:hypothetical protein
MADSITAGDRLKLTDVSNWGTLVILLADRGFLQDAQNLVISGYLMHLHLSTISLYQTV